MVEIKLINYLDGIIIECIDDKNARAVVPHKYIHEQYKKTHIPPYRKSPLTVIMKRLESDFNYTNLGEYRYSYFTDEKAIYYNFHRNIID